MCSGAVSVHGGIGSMLPALGPAENWVGGVASISVLQSGAPVSAELSSKSTHPPLHHSRLAGVVCGWCDVTQMASENFLKSNKFPHLVLLAMALVCCFSRSGIPKYLGSASTPRYLFVPDPMPVFLLPDGNLQRPLLPLGPPVGC